MVKNASGRRAAEVFMETTEEHKVLKPIKRAKFHKSHSHGIRSIAWENWSYRASWRGGHCTKIRDAPAEKRRDAKVQRSSTRTEMLLLWCFSAPYWEIILAASGAHCTISSHITILKVWNWPLLRSKGKVRNWVQRRSYDLNLCEAHGLNTWGQLPRLMKNDRKFCIMRRTSCSSFVVQSLIDSFFHALLHLRLRRRYRRTMKFFIMCPATIRSENMSEQA